MQKIEIDGRQYTVEGNPTMRTVKYVEEMEIEMMRQYLDDETLMQLESAEEDEVVSEMMEGADVEDLKKMMWERSAQEPLQTICLGTDKCLTIDELESMKARDFMELREACESALGGGAEDFIAELGIGISSRAREIQEQLETETGQTSSQSETPPAVSNLSSGQ